MSYYVSYYNFAFAKHGSHGGARIPWIPHSHRSQIPTCKHQPCARATRAHVQQTYCIVSRHGWPWRCCLVSGAGRGHAAAPPGGRYENSRALSPCGCMNFPAPARGGEEGQGGEGAVRSGLGGRSRIRLSVWQRGRWRSRPSCPPSSPTRPALHSREREARA